MLDRERALDAHAIVSITDRGGRILYANDQFCAISGYSEAELLGQTHRILKSGAHPDSFYAEMWTTIARGEVWEGEICNRKKDGGLYWVKSTVVPFLDENGRPVQYIGIRTDITARKAFESELIARRAEAEAASRAKSEFLANMSHEIRTPMNGIIGMTDLALDAASEEERQEYMKIVKNSAESLLGILNDILDFSKIEANKLMLERVGFALHQAVSETLKTLGVRASEKGLELICDVADDVPEHVLGDPTRLRQVLINLIGNAIKFTAHGKVVVSLAVETRTDTSVTLQIAVRDSGIGIPADKLDSIFEAFAQADASTTRQYGGTGLGLSISSRLVNLMGGQMSVDSEPGKGSTFQFTLILGLDNAPLAPLAAAPAPPPPHQSFLDVLLVEDNPINQQLAIRLLEKWGHRVTLAVHGQEAVDRLCDGARYDLVLMDMQMPVLGGIEATRLIRAHEAAQGLPRVPIMAMTANAMQGDREACLAAGMDDYLSKPINQVELAAKLRLFAPQGAPANAAPVRNALPEAGRAVTPAPTFDYAAALAVMDAEIIDILAPAFLDHYQNELASLRAGIAAGDSAEVMRRAHGLKGTLAAFGAEPAMRRAAEIETLAKAEDLAGLPPLLHGLEEEVAKLVAVLRR
jgi:PAS domain S-box-containing protein